jgi:hypothetical protein
VTSGMQSLQRSECPNPRFYYTMRIRQGFESGSRMIQTDAARLQQ